MSCWRICVVLLSKVQELTSKGNFFLSLPIIFHYILYLKRYLADWHFNSWSQQIFQDDKSQFFKILSIDLLEILAT